jgi:hypothetical protein
MTTMRSGSRAIIGCIPPALRLKRSTATLANLPTSVSPRNRLIRWRRMVRASGRLAVG